MLTQWVWLCFVIFLGTRLLSPAPSLDAHGFSVWMQAVSAILLFLYVFLTSLGVGRKILRFLHDLSRLEYALLSLLIGFAILADGILVLGLLGLFNPTSIFIWMVLSGFFASFQWKGIFAAAQDGIKSLNQIRFQRFGLFEVLLLGVSAALLIILPIVALAPVRDYDALMYHLEIPRQFLLHGGIYFDPVIWRSAYPMLTEMLFTIGIVFHLEPFTQLLSLAFCLVFFLSVFAFGRRFFDQKTALLAVGILLGNPGFPIYATVPGIEFSWSSYEFWGIYAFALWLFADKTKNRAVWLVLSGVLCGLAASAKFLSFPTILVLGLLVFWKSIQLEKADLKKIVQNLLFFGLPALLVISPWYIKNWIWTGNPFYPLVFGGVGWSSIRQQLIFTDYMGSFGTGKSWLDYVLIPVNLYLAQPRFATMLLEIFHPASWFAFAYIFVKGWRKHDYLIGYIWLGFLIWVFSSPVIRFLLPLTGYLALLSARVLTQFPRVIRQAVSFGLIGAFMLVTVIYQVWIFADSSVPGYLGGKLSTSEFLQKEVYNYKTIQFIQANLQPTDRVLFLWEGQGYYCDARCLPDNDESLAVQLLNDSPGVETLAHQLHSQGITHILMGGPTAFFFINSHDPRNRHRMALEYFEKVFFPTCAKSIYTDHTFELYRLVCQ